ncbi:MAG: nicotinate (nicotinamide) nucleotide adenylyltransferase [Bacteroidales bacterium]
MKIGILGGSFNPIHVGHAILANYILQYTDVEQVWLMLSPHNPLKDKSEYINDTHRIAMVQLVAERVDNITASDFEFSLPTPSYTINTLDKLSEKYPEHQFHIIIGTDNLIELNRWRDYQRIVSEYGVIVYPRRGYNETKLTVTGNIQHINSAPLIEVSSTMIREGISQGKDMNFFLTDDVYKYIQKNNLYE